jgi:hypothetical protein
MIYKSFCIHIFMGLYTIAKFCLEAGRLTNPLVSNYASQMRHELAGTSFGLDGPARDFLQSIHKAKWAVGQAGYLGIKLFDLYAPGANLQTRLHVGNATLIACGLTGMADDVIDTRNQSLDEKRAFLDSILGVLQTGERKDAEDIEKRKTYVLARMMHGLVREDTRLLDSYRLLTDLVMKQFETTDPLEAHELVTAIGAHTADPIITAAEVASRKRDDNLRTAIRSFGSYLQTLDTIADMDIDLAQGVNTYPVLMIRSHGNTRRVKAEAKAILAREAKKMLDQSLRHCTPEQQDIVTTLGQLGALKYSLA